MKQQFLVWVKFIEDFQGGDDASTVCALGTESCVHGGSCDDENAGGWAKFLVAGRVLGDVPKGRVHPRYQQNQRGVSRWRRS